MVEALGARLGPSASRCTRCGGGASGAMDVGRCCCGCVPMHPQHSHARPNATSERRQSIVHLRMVSCPLSVVSCETGELRERIAIGEQRTTDNGQLTNR